MKWWRLFIILLPFLSLAITFERYYGGFYHQKGYCVHNTQDGGYIICGEHGMGGYDVYCIKTDSLGDTLWTNRYGQGYIHEAGYSLKGLDNGAFVIVGLKDTISSIPADLYLIKINSSGDSIWSKLYGGDSLDIGYWIEITPDSCFIIVGETKSFGQGNSDVWLIKTDSWGNILWSKTYGGTSYDMGRVVKNVPDGGFIIVGSTYSFGNGFRDVYLIRVDSLGNLIWQKTYGGYEYEWGHDVEVATDGYIICGQTNSFGFGAQDILLIKTDTLGDTLWWRTYGGPFFDDIGYAVTSTHDGGYAICGYTDSYGAGSGDIYLLKVDSFGNLIWQKTYGGVKEDRGYDIEEVWDCGFIITGYTYSGPNDTLHSDLYLIKTDSLGNVMVEEKFSTQPGWDWPGLSCHPNPFSDQTVITGCAGDLSIYDTAGQRVRSFPSCNSFIWDGCDDSGRPLPSGIYFVELQDRTYHELIKIVKLK